MAMEQMKKSGQAVRSMAMELMINDDGTDEEE